MKVRMLALAAGPDGVMQAGRTYDVDAKTGKALVDGGYAADVTPPKPKKQAAPKESDKEE